MQDSHGQSIFWKKIFLLFSNTLFECEEFAIRPQKPSLNKDWIKFAIRYLANFKKNHAIPDIRACLEPFFFV